MKRALALSVLFLLGCKSNAVNVYMTVFPDGAGEMQYYGWIPVDAASGEKANKDGIFMGMRDMASFDVNLRIIVGKFDKVDKAAVGDCTFAFEKKGEGFVMRVTIPTTASAKWYKTLGLTQAHLDKMKELEKIDAAKKATEEKNDEPVSVIFAITMPGKIEKQRLSEPDKAPEWKMDAEERDGMTPDDAGKNTAWLMIPIEDVLKGSTKRVVWEITCGPMLEKVQKSWDKFKGEGDKEPERVTVQHILVSFKGALPDVERSKEEAEKLAKELLERAKKGEDFAALVKTFSNDSGEGIYTMVNRGVTAGENEHDRELMVKGFGDGSFKLKVGEIGLVPYDKEQSPYGWHILKRIK